MPQKTAPKKQPIKTNAPASAVEAPVTEPVKVEPLLWRDLKRTHQDIVSRALDLKVDGGEIPAKYADKIRKAVAYTNDLGNLHTSTSIPLVAAMTEIILTKDD